MADTAEFFEAIKSGDLQKVRTMVDCDPKLVDAESNGVAALMFAVYNRKQPVVDFLLQRGAKIDFFQAAALNNVDVMERALKENPQLARAFSKDGFTALGLASFFGSTEAAQLLLNNKADPNDVSKNSMKVAPLHSAVANRDPQKSLELTTLLLRHGAKVNIAQEGGWTPLHQAAAHGAREIVRMLLDRGADPRAISTDGRTPAQMAEAGKFPEVAALLS
jgi:ankyrin repeat protein